MNEMSTLLSANWTQPPANDLLLVLLGLLATGLGLLILIQRATAPGSRLVQRLGQQSFWQRLASPPQHEFPLAAAVTLLLSMSVFALLALLVSQGNSLAGLDQAMAALFRSLRSPARDPLLVLITSVGDSAHLIGLSLIAVATLWHKGDRAGALHWAAAVGLLLMLNLLFKEGLAIPRPQYLADPLSTYSYSFPSAHSSNSTLFFALCAGFIARSLSASQRLWLYAGSAIPIVAIPLSRLYLGVHWLSDVTAGICLGLSVGALALISYNRYYRPLHGQRRDLIPLAAALLWSTVYLCWRFTPALNGYQPLPG